MAYNHSLVLQILKHLDESQMETADICANDFGVKQEHFGQQLDAMVANSFICEPPGVFPFSMLIIDDSTKVSVVMASAGKELLYDDK